jgi:hypothetical protein
MNDSTAAHVNEPVAVLAALLHALAEGADGIRGRHLWESLTELIGGQDANGAAGVAGAAELAVLRNEPSADRAVILARVLFARADADEDFGDHLRAWRGQEQIRATSERAVSAAVTAAGARTAPAGPDQEPSPDPGSTGSEPRWRTYLSSPWSVTIVGGIVASVTAAVIAAYLITGNGSPTASPANAVTSSGTARPSGTATPSSSAAPLGAAAPAAGSTVAGTAADSPARVEAVTPLSPAPDETFAVKNKVQLTTQQLARFNADNRSGGAGSAATTSFLSSIHAVPTSSAFTNVTVIGNEKATVTITGLQVVKHCQAPLGGTLFDSPSQGVNGTIGIGFDLDSPVDYARKSDYGLHGGDFFRDHVVTLAPGETQTFTIGAQTLLHYCQFSFKMTVATPGGAVTENINDNGQPFGLTAKNPGSTDLPYSGYAAAYVGGIEASLIPSLHDPRGNFIQVNPKTFHS